MWWAKLLWTVYPWILSQDCITGSGRACFVCSNFPGCDRWNVLASSSISILHWTDRGAFSNSKFSSLSWCPLMWIGTMLSGLIDFRMLYICNFRSTLGQKTRGNDTFLRSTTFLHNESLLWHLKPSILKDWLHQMKWEVEQNLSICNYCRYTHAAHAFLATMPQSPTFSHYIGYACLEKYLVSHSDWWHWENFSTKMCNTFLHESYQHLTQ